jgi:Na+-driven multidrug efflux pump
VRISLPTVGETATGITGQLWYLSIINRLGAVSTAAHGVAIKCESIAYLMVGGFAAPAGILAGQYLGANRPELAKRAANMCLLLGNILLAFMGVTLFFLDEEMFQLFLGSGKPELIATGAPMLPVVAFAMPGLATINVLATTFRGAGETRTPWYNATIGFFLFRIPITYLLARPEDGSFWAMGLKGAWVAMLVDLNLRGLLLAIKYFKGGWTNTKI